jgi:hypothetical protein
MPIEPSAGDVVIAVAGAALLVACSVALVLHVAVALAAARLHVRTHREQRAAHRWGRAMARATVYEDAPHPRRVGRLEAPIVLEQWIALRDAVVDGRGLVQLARGVGLADAARRLVRRGSGRAHLVGVVALGWLGDESDGAALERIARRSAEPVATAALASLVRLDVAAAFPPLRRRLRRGAQPLPVLVTAALMQARGGVLQALVRNEAKARPIELPGLLRVIALRRDAEGLPAVRAALLHRDVDAESLAAALYAIAEIGGPSDVVFAARLLHHHSWTVRVRAIHAVARLGGSAYTARIASLLEDDDPWVRRRAAEAVVRDPHVRVDTAALSAPAQMAYAEAITCREVAA